MAELGDFLLGANDPEVERVKVEVTMLDYDYVQTCNKMPELKAILKMLKSGKEGRYPHLEKTVEEKVLSMLPEKDRKKVLSMRSEASSSEIYDEEKELNAWLESMGGTSKPKVSVPVGITEVPPVPPSSSGDIFGDDPAPPAPPPVTSSGGSRYPPVRGSKEAGLNNARKARGEKAPAPAYTESKPRLNKESMSNRDYFRAWDKFDVEAEEKALEEAEQEGDERAQQARYEARRKEEKNRIRRQKEMAKLRDSLNFDSMSEKERTWMAQREKNKGNECFRSGENDDALLYYSRSIALDDSNAIVYANRAMANIRLNNFDAAVSDCTMSIALDPTYTKALSRRGMVHHRCGRYSLAEDDFAAALKMDPTNKEFAALLMRSKEKRKDVEGEATHQKTKKKVMIQEVSDSEDEDEEEEEEEIFELGADGFDVSAAPSKKIDLDVVSNFIAASKFKGEKAGMVFKLGEHGLGYYKDEKKGKKGVKKSKPQEAKKPKAAFKKVVIEESDSEEDSDEEVEVKVNVKRTTGNEKSVKLKDQGNAAMAKGEFKEAVRLYGESLKLDGNNVASLNNRSLAWLKLNDGKNAKKDATACIEKSSTPNVKAFYRRGLAGVLIGEKESLLQSKEDFEKVLELEPDNTTAMKELQELEVKLVGTPIKVDAQLDGEGNSGSNDSSPMGFTKLSLEEVEEAKEAQPSPNAAKKTKKIVIEDDSDESDEEEDEDEEKSNKLKDEGNALLKVGKNTDAIAKYDEAIELWTRNVAAINNKCMALIKMESFEEGEKAADEVLKIEPENVKAVFRKACCIVGRGEKAGVEGLKEAMELFEKSVKLGGGGGEKCKERVLCLKLISKLEESLKREKLRHMSKEGGAGVASPNVTPSKGVIDRKVEETMEKLKSSSIKVDVGSFSVPKTTTEMETAVRSLMVVEDGKKVVEYLEAFKAGTWKKCFKDSMDPDLLGGIFTALEKNWDEDAGRAKKITGNIAKVAGGLSMVFMVMKDEGRNSLKKLIENVKGDSSTAKQWKKSFKEAI
mmetsp:Transcript_19069/g.39713  ORF Transcript_19069/g.39713 Transcript_19069/m.39713 type:complete len:1022 (-) Transcript_19069:75-3140(-)